MIFNKWDNILAECDNILTECDNILAEWDNILTEWENISPKWENISPKWENNWPEWENSWPEWENSWPEWENILTESDIILLVGAQSSEFGVWRCADAQNLHQSGCAIHERATKRGSAMSASNKKNTCTASRHTDIVIQSLNIYSPNYHQMMCQNKIIEIDIDFNDFEIQRLTIYEIKRNH